MIKDRKIIPLSDDPLKLHQSGKFAVALSLSALSREEFSLADIEQLLSRVYMPIAVVGLSEASENLLTDILNSPKFCAYIMMSVGKILANDGDFSSRKIIPSDIVYHKLLNIECDDDFFYGEDSIGEIYLIERKIVTPRIDLFHNQKIRRLMGIEVSEW